MKKKSFKEEFEAFKAIALKYVRDVRDRKGHIPYKYTAHEPGKNLTPGGVTTNNVVSVSELYAHVQTAAALNFDTKLSANNGVLFVEFVEKLPYVPDELRS